MDYLITYITDDGLKHHGILGQKWGVRRYQNEDGTLTAAGKKRYSNVSEYSTAVKRTVSNASDAVKTKYKNADKKKLALGIAAGVTGAAALAYGIKNPEALKKMGSALTSGFKKGAMASGEAAGKAAIGVLGAFAMSELTEYTASRASSTKGERLANQLIQESGSASIKSLTSTLGGSTGTKAKTEAKPEAKPEAKAQPESENKSPINVGKPKEPPKGTPADKTSNEWRKMMDDINAADGSAVLKYAMKSAARNAQAEGYSQEQIEAYMEDIYRNAGQ